MDLIGKFRNFAPQMCDMKAYKIDLRDLKDDVQTFNFHVDDDFFEAIQTPEIRRGNLDVDVLVRKVTNMFEISIHSKGMVCIPCDICLDDMEQPIDTEDSLYVKLGFVDEENDSDDILTVDEEQGIFDVSWFIYEFIALSIPIKHVHVPGKCNQEMLQVIREHQVGDQDDVEQPIDSRWQELLKIKDKG